MHHFKCKSRTVHNALKTGCLLLVWSVSSWLKTTTAAGMGQPARGAPITPEKKARSKLRGGVSQQPTSHLTLKTATLCIISEV